MAFIDDLSKKITNTGQTTIQKSKEMADIVKYNSMIYDKQRQLKGIYESLGKRYIELYENNPDPAFMEFVAATSEINKTINEYREKIKILQGLTTCPSCNSPIQQNQKFCSVCGTQIAMQNQKDIVVKYCRYCGKGLHDNVKFCGTCGKPVNSNTEDSQAGSIYGAEAGSIVPYDESYNDLDELYDEMAEAMQNNNQDKIL